MLSYAFKRSSMCESRDLTYSQMQFLKNSDVFFIYMNVSTSLFYKLMPAYICMKNFYNTCQII